MLIKCLFVLFVCHPLRTATKLTKALLPSTQAPHSAVEEERSEKRLTAEPTHVSNSPGRPTPAAICNDATRDKHKSAGPFFLDEYGQSGRGAFHTSCVQKLCAGVANASEAFAMRRNPEDWQAGRIINRSSTMFW